MEHAEDTLKILVVEDNDVDRLAIHRLIQDGARVIGAATLQAAMSVVQSDRPDCILVDYTLPDGTAVELLARLETINDSPPVIILAGLDDERTALEALKFGAQDYLLKSELGAGRGLWRAIRYAVERQEVLRLRDQMVHSQRLSAIGQLAAGVAHEINNPACYILANLGYIRESLAQLRGRLGDGADPQTVADTLIAEGALARALDDADEALADSIHGTERICKIVRELRPFSHIERSELSPLDFNQVVESAINLTRNEIRHRAQLVTELGALPPFVGDRAKLCQVVVNLIANATQSIESGDADKNTITIRTQLEGSDIVLEVADTGSGIDDAVRDRVFEPFFSTRERDIGTGLGLAICAETVRKHGGSIEVDSAPGAGATFTIRIPRHSVAARVEGASSPTAAPGQARLLLVDDDRLVRAGLRRMLAPPHDVTEADSGAAALDLIATNDYDVIICDLMMPEVDGPAVYEQLASDRPELLGRIVFLTGGAFTPRAREFVSSVEALVLEKPVSRSSLLDTIETLRGEDVVEEAQQGPAESEGYD